MPPTPIYRVKVNTDYLPGYVQNENYPWSGKAFAEGILNRNGGKVQYGGANNVNVTLDFILLSSLGTATSLEHIDDLKSQYRSARSIVARAGRSKVYIGDMTRYLWAVGSASQGAFVAGKDKSLPYSVEWLAEPYLIDDTPVTDTFSGNGAFSLTIPDSGETYPILTVPSGVTAFIATHASGKAVEFTRGSFTGTITIDCGDFSVVNDSGVNASATMDGLNYGIVTDGPGDLDLTITGFGGSGSVTVSVSPRYEF